MNEHLEKRLRDKGITPAEVQRAITGAEPEAPLPERLRNPRTPYSPAALREEAAARIEALERELAEANADTARLDFLDECNARLNARSGTVYGWAMVMNHNVNRLMTDNHHLAVDLHDSKAHGAPSCRIAIDAEMKRIAAHRARTETNHDR